MFSKVDQPEKIEQPPKAEPVKPNDGSLIEIGDRMSTSVIGKSLKNTGATENASKG